MLAKSLTLTALCLGALSTAMPTPDALSANATSHNLEARNNCKKCYSACIDLQADCCGSENNYGEFARLLYSCSVLVQSWVLLQDKGTGVFPLCLLWQVLGEMLYMLDNTHIHTHKMHDRN